MNDFAWLRPTFISLAILGWAGSSSAQSTADKAAAEALFDQGRQAMQASDFAKACGLLERSQRIDPAVGTLLYLAECYEKSGRTASAWATFREAADTADAAHAAERARTGRKRAERLEPLLSRLTIQIAPEAQSLAGLVIQRRGQQVQPALFNVPVPVDPGDYEVQASAPGYESWSQSVTVGDNAAHLSVAVPPLKPSAAEESKTASPASPSAIATVTPAAPEPVPSAPDSSAYPPSGGRKTLAYVLGGAGVVGVGMGSFFGVRAISKN